MFPTEASAAKLELVSFAQAAFHVFGMELLCRLDLQHTNAFFATFFRLPGFYWRGFLGSTLSSAQLLAFAMLTFAIAPPSIQSRLVAHLLTDPAGSYLVRAYLGKTSACLETSTTLSHYVCCLRAASTLLPGCRPQAGQRATTARAAAGDRRPSSSNDLDDT